MGPGGPAAEIWAVVLLVVLMAVVVKLVRWFWKVNQQFQQVQLLKEETAKTALLVEQVAAQLKLINEQLYQEKQEQRQSDRHTN